MSFDECKNNIGKQFLLNDEWFPFIPYVLLRFKNGFLVFFKKVGRTEYRVELTEELFKRHKITIYG